MSVANLYSRARRLPRPVVFVLCALAMLAVPIALSAATGADVGGQGADAAMKAAPVWLLVVVGALVPPIEALLWTFCFIEGANAMASRPQWGALAGTVAYGLVYHSAGGAVTMLASTWVAIVVNLSYLALRRGSRVRALLWVTGLRWTFVGFGLLAYKGIV